MKREPDVFLSAGDLRHAERLGLTRHEESLRMGLKDKHGAKAKDSIRNHFMGAAGEVAVCRYFGLPRPDSVNTFQLPDLPGNIGVRTRAHEHYDLIVRDNDPDLERFILVWYREPNRARIRGWITGEMARRERWRKSYGNREPAYFVPAQSLNAIDTIYGG
jgi:hypothetical protein